MAKNIIPQGLFYGEERQQINLGGREQSRSPFINN